MRMISGTTDQARPESRRPIIEIVSIMRSTDRRRSERRKRLGSNERLVALILASHCDRSASCWISVRQLAIETGLSEATVKRALRTLCSTEGLFDRTGARGRHAKTYTLRQPGLCEPAQAEPVLDGDLDEFEPAQIDPQPAHCEPCHKEEQTPEQTRVPLASLASPSTAIEISATGVKAVAFEGVSEPPAHLRMAAKTVRLPPEGPKLSGNFCRSAWEAYENRCGQGSGSERMLSKTTGLGKVVPIYSEGFVLTAWQRYCSECSCPTLSAQHFVGQIAKWMRDGPGDRGGDGRAGKATAGDPSAYGALLARGSR
jgi:hypothetical protein